MIVKVDTTFTDVREILKDLVGDERGLWYERMMALVATETKEISEYLTSKANGMIDAKTEIALSSCG